MGNQADVVQRPEAWKEAIRPTTRAMLVETITNPLMRVPRLRECRELVLSDHGLGHLDGQAVHADGVRDEPRAGVQVTFDRVRGRFEHTLFQRFVETADV